MSSHLLFFPCRGAKFEWFGGDGSSGAPRVTVELLAEQREFERQPKNRGQRVRCVGCGNPGAIYVACCHRGKPFDKLYLRKFPGSGQWHRPTCYSHSRELLPLPDQLKPNREPPVIVPDSTFAGVRFDRGDPEFRVLAMRESRAPFPRDSIPRRQDEPRRTVGLQRVARELLQRSGLCTSLPEYALARTQRDFNGLVKGVYSSLATDLSSLTGALMNSLPGVNFVPWGYLDERARRTPDQMQSCVGWGFVNDIGGENRHGAKLLRLSNNPGCPLVLPRSIVEREENNPRSPLNFYRAVPVWVMFVAGLFEDTWKIHSLAPFRLSRRGLIQVESDHEERMVNYLVERDRSFIRWLLTPPELTLTRWIPDFQLIDTASRLYLEVAGRMHDPKYAANIAQKAVYFGSDLLIWDTQDAISTIVIPPPDARGAVIQYLTKLGLNWRSSSSDACGRITPVS